MTTLEIEYRTLSELHPRVGNPRTHSKKQVEQIAASIRKFGFVNPVLVDDSDGVVAGHGRLEAARLLDLPEVPTLRLSDMSPENVRAYVIADNKLAENAGWDKDLLATEFKFLSELEIDFDVTVTGFELAEIDGLLGLGTAGTEGGSKYDEVPDLAEAPITQLGDIWQIGDHRLICGDATSADTFAQLLEDERAAMVFCDPPYNVPIDGHVSGLGETRHREFAMAAGEMTKDEFTSFLCRVFFLLKNYSVDGSIHYHFMDWRHQLEILQAGEAAYTELKNLCIWAKTNGGMGSLYRSAHELVFVFKSGKASHINNVELGKNGRHRTNVWSYAGVNSFGRNRVDLTMHPTVKPIGLVLDAILDCSRRKDIVLDAFAGSGTTLVAAQRAKRRGYGIEIDPLYCDTIIRRLQRLFKLSAVRISDGTSFDRVCEQTIPAPAREEVA